MKTKIRVKSFMRHNKYCVGIWCAIPNFVVAILPPYGVASTIFSVCIGCVFLLLWREERRSDRLARINVINCQYANMLAQNLVKKIQKLQDENMELQKELIEKDAEVI